MHKNQKVSAAVTILLLSLIFQWGCKEDTDPPVIRLKGNDTITTLLHQPFVDPGVIAFDREDYDLAKEVVVSGNLDTKRQGYYQITYSVTDAAGNSSQIGRTVMVEYRTAAIIGTYRSSNALSYCTGLGISEISVTQNRIQIEPAIGYYQTGNNLILADFNNYLLHTMPILSSGRLPCNYYVQGGTLTISHNADSIRAFCNVVSLDNTIHTYAIIDYVRQ